MCGDGEGNDECLEADANVVLTRQNCLVNTVGNSSVTIYNKMVGATVAVAVSIE